MADKPNERAPLVPLVILWELELVEAAVIFASNQGRNNRLKLIEVAVTFGAECARLRSNELRAAGGK